MRLGEGLWDPQRILSGIGRMTAAVFCWRARDKTRVLDLGERREWWWSSVGFTIPPPLSAQLCVHRGCLMMLEFGTMRWTWGRKVDGKIFVITWKYSQRRKGDYSRSSIELGLRHSKSKKDLDRCAANSKREQVATQTSISNKTFNHYRWERWDYFKINQIYTLFTYKISYKEDSEEKLQPKNVNYNHKNTEKKIPNSKIKRKEAHVHHHHQQQQRQQNNRN